MHSVAQTESSSAMSPASVTAAAATPAGTAEPITGTASTTNVNATAFIDSGMVNQAADFVAGRI